MSESIKPIVPYVSVPTSPAPAHGDKEVRRVGDLEALLKEDSDLQLMQGEYELAMMERNRDMELMDLKAAQEEAFMDHTHFRQETDKDLAEAQEVYARVPCLKHAVEEALANSACVVEHCKQAMNGQKPACLCWRKYMCHAELKSLEEVYEMRKGSFIEDAVVYNMLHNKNKACPVELVAILQAYRNCNFGLPFELEVACWINVGDKSFKWVVIPWRVLMCFEEHKEKCEAFWARQTMAIRQDSERRNVPNMFTDCRFVRPRSGASHSRTTSEKFRRSRGLLLDVLIKLEFPFE